MTVPLLFALVGSVILVGFLANLLFRLTKIPSVLILVALGVVLGPVTGWIRSDALLAIAPYFGAAALLVILFEGGLELEIAHVVRQAPRTALLAVVVFGLSLTAVAGLAYGFLGFSPINALMLGAILGATSPAICMPVVSGLSVRNDVKTVIKLESAMGEVLLIVTVVLLLESHETGSTDAAGWVWGFARSLSVAVLISSVAGVLWSRLVGWLGREPLSYMLTLGMVCLLYFAVEELGGSTAIAILLFGLILANMESIAGRIGPRFRELFGVNIREEQFVLDQFVMNITAELSFLVRAFFFVYLGLLLDFSALSYSLAAWILAIFGLLLASRRVGVALFSRRGASFQPAELQVIMALQPRGLATAVVAFIPMQSGVSGTHLFPLYAFVVIVLSNLYMTGGLIFAERQLRLSPRTPSELPEDPETFPEGTVRQTAIEAGAVAEPTWTPAAANPVATRSHALSPAADFADEPAPTRFTDWMARFFGLRLEDREAEYAEMIRASYLSEPLFWVQAVLGAAICALGLILDQVAIIIGGALIVPLARPVIATGLALAAGDIYLLAKLLVKLLGFGVMAVLLSAILIDLVPFGATTGEIVARTRPTILDFLVALFGGMSGAALISLRRRAFTYLPGAVIAITLLPSLCVMGFGLGGGFGGSTFTGAGLQFTANLFAAVLGAGAILTLVGIPRAAQCAAVQHWKEEELARPFVRAVFGRLRLQHVIGRTGSVRARVIVVGIFLLALLVPLQVALNQLALEYRTRQAISQAQRAFDVADRSTVINSSTTFSTDMVDVRMQVATSEPFTAVDVAAFERYVTDQAGRRTRLNLVQTFGDIGQADTIQRLLAGRNQTAAATPARTVSEALQDVGALVKQVLAELPLPEALRVVSVRGALAGTGGPALEVVYLADAELGRDGQAILARILASRTGIDGGRVALRWMPASVTLQLSRGGSVARGDAEALAAVGVLLAGEPGLSVVLELPAGLTAPAADAARKQVQSHIGLAELTVVPAPPATKDGTATIRVTIRG